LINGMDNIKRLFVRLGRWEYSGIVFLVLVTLALHFAVILHPPELVFDEQYYVPSARYILHGLGTDRIDHPPLGQLFIAAGIWLFGDNPFGWRFFSVVFGVVGLVFFYLVCRRLGLGLKYAYLAAFLLAFENLGFVQSGVAMLDVFSLTFMMAAFWFYLRNRYAFSGIMAGLATLSKLTGVLVVLVILLHWLIVNRKRHLELLALVVLAPATFFVLMPLLDFAVWHRWLNPFSQVATMLDINAASTFASSSSVMLSRPWEWLLRPVILTYWEQPHYLAMISPPLWALIMPVVLFVIFRSLKRDGAPVFSLAWFIGAYLVWIPASLITDRTSYVFYFYPAVGAVCIGLALLASSLDSLASNLQENRWKRCLGMVVPVYLLLCLAAFVVLSPVSYWWKVPLGVLAYIASRYWLALEQLPSTKASTPSSII
jgi:dolichyl-phosphate-mannose-protein mannosyltransferase